MLPSLIFAAALAAQPAAAPVPSAPGVVAYPPAFFVDSQPSNAFDMIGRLPGFTFDAGEEVRGFGGAAGNVLIDGQRPSSKSDDLESILRRIPVAAVERIELIRSGAAGVDMRGKTLLANVVHKTGGGFRGLAAVSTTRVYDGRELYGVRLEGSGKLGDKGWELALNSGSGVDDGAGDGPHTRYGPDGAVLSVSDDDQDAILQQVILDAALDSPLAGGKLRVNGHYFHELFEYDEIDRGVIPGPSRFVEEDKQTRNDGEIGGRYLRDFGSKLGLEAVVLQRLRRVEFTSKTEDVDGPALFDVDQKTGESIARAQLNWRPTARLAFEGGAEGAFNWLESQTAFALDGQDIPLPAANVRVEETRGELFSTATWRPSPKLSLEAGLRLEGSHISSDGDVMLEKTLYFAKPRLSATWAVSGNDELRLRLEREVGQLNFDDFVASSSLNGGGVKVGNPDLDPQQAWVAEAAFEHRFWTKGAVSLTLRHSELTDVIDRVPIADLEGGLFDAPGNLGDGRKDEVAANLTVPLDRLWVKNGLLRAQSTWRYSSVTDPTTGEKRQISGLRPNEWEVNFSQDLPQWKANWGLDLSGGWRERYFRFDQVETYKLHPWLTLFVEYRLRPDITFRGELQNVTARNFETIREYYDGPRASGPASVTDLRNLEFGRGIYFRVRKTLGG